MMIKPRTLVFVGAHPDDESFGMGGTLAQYAADGVKVYYVCATRGEVGPADPEFLKGYATAGDMRWAELKCAASILGLVDVIHLGYRDSGMPGWKDNQHPDALMMAPLEEVTGRLVKIFRDLKPEVVVTFDPIGGYRHPDHIAIHNATVKAFQAAADPNQYPDAGLPFHPQKLYFSVFPNRMLKVMVKLMPLVRRNPRQFGRNKDIDLTALTNVNFPIHASIRLTNPSIQARDKATACHASQMGGGPRGSIFFRLINRIFGQRDLFMRAYPPVTRKVREKDLFKGIT